MEKLIGLVGFKFQAIFKTSRTETSKNLTIQWCF